MSYMEYVEEGERITPREPLFSFQDMLLDCLAKRKFYEEFLPG